MVATPIEAFHAHLGQCEKCRNHPFGLCSKGFALLGAAAGMRDEDGQLDLFDETAEVRARPMVRCFLRSLAGGQV